MLFRSHHVYHSYHTCPTGIRIVSTLYPHYPQDPVLIGGPQPISHPCRVEPNCPVSWPESNWSRTGGCLDACTTLLYGHMSLLRLTPHVCHEWSGTSFGLTTTFYGIWRDPSYSTLRPIPCSPRPQPCCMVGSTESQCRKTGSVHPHESQSVWFVILRSNSGQPNWPIYVTYTPRVSLVQYTKP